MDMLDQLRVWCSGAVVASAIILIACERMFPFHDQPLLRKGFGTDLIMYALAQSFVLGLVISYVITFIDDHTGISRLQVLRTQSVWVQFIIVFIVHDLYIYWFHRWQHNNALLWRIHEAHHSAKDVDWLSGSRSHSLEILVNQTIEFAPILLLCSPELAVIKGSVDAIWGMYIHANIDVRSGWLQCIINGPEMHRWHHASDDNAHNKNFSTKLAIWDWLFGTAYRPAHVKPQAYGLDAEFPSNYFEQHAYAFRRNERHRQ